MCLSARARARAIIAALIVINGSRFSLSLSADWYLPIGRTSIGNMYRVPLELGPPRGNVARGAARNGVSCRRGTRLVILIETGYASAELHGSYTESPSPGHAQ